MLFAKAKNRTIASYSNQTHFDQSLLKRADGFEPIFTLCSGPEHKSTRWLLKDKRLQSKLIAA